MQTENQKQQQKQSEADLLQTPKIVNIATIVRIRPLLECQKDLKQSIKCKDQTSLQINLSGQLRRQKLEKVFGVESTQKQVFKSLQPLINKCSSGYNVTIFTYGQTGTGKTHTMFGSDWNNIIKKINTDKLQAQETFLRSIEQDENHSGLIPRSIHHLFNEMIIKRKRFIKVYCSFLQLYNQSMLDLLQDDGKLAKQKKMFIHENSTDGIYIEGLNQMFVQDADQCLELMKKGERNRVVRQTSMNIKSSRSHTVFQLLIQEVFPAKKTFRRMKLNLCDLAGSEKINKNEKMQSEHLEELKNINLSLTTLGKVISSLSDKKKAPYRESKLTRILQDSLAGNTFTAIIATITTKANCLDESLNTLKFLQRAKQIKSELISKQISNNETPQLKNLQKEVAYLKDILKIKRTGGIPIDLDLSQKYKKLQHQNSKLKQLVDQELVEKLKKQNLNLKLQLQKKNNDDLSENLIKSGYTVNYNHSNSRNFTHNQDSQGGYRIKKQHRTIEQPKPQHNSYHKDEQIQSSFTSSSFNGIIKKKNFQTYNSSTDGSHNTKFSMFPSVGKRMSGIGSANKILERIQQIEKVKIINKMKLEKELDSIKKVEKGKDVIVNSTDNYTTFTRGSRYSSKYRY